MYLQQPAVCPSCALSPDKHRWQGAPLQHCAAQESNTCWLLRSTQGQESL